MKAKRCCNQICCVRLMYTCESFIIIFSKMLLNPARKEKLYTHPLFKYFYNNLRYACMKVSRWCIHKHMHLFTFCCCIWSFKACMTYQLLNSTLFVMASRNSEKVHHVQIGDNAIFFSRWLQLISQWNKWKRRHGSVASNGHIHTQHWDVILPAGSDGKFWFLYSLANKLLKFMPKPKTLLWAGLWNPSGYLATIRKEVGRQEGSETVQGSNSVSSAEQTLYRSLHFYRYLCWIYIATEMQ